MLRSELLPKPKAKAYEADTRFKNPWHHEKTEFNDCFIEYFLKHSAKEDISLWVWKSFRTLHWRGAWQLVRLWTPHDNPIPDADIGYYVNFTRFCILTVCSQPIRVLMSNDFRCLEIPHTDAPPKFLYKLSPTKQVINLLAGKYFPVSCRWGKKLLQ